MKPILEVHVPPEWEAAILACVDEAPPRPRSRMWSFASLITMFFHH